MVQYTYKLLPREAVLSVEVDTVALLSTEELFTSVVVLSTEVFFTVVAGRSASVLGVDIGGGDTSSFGVLVSFSTLPFGFLVEAFLGAFFVLAFARAIVDQFR